MRLKLKKRPKLLKQFNNFIVLQASTNIFASKDLYCKEAFPNDAAFNNIFCSLGSNSSIAATIQSNTPFSKTKFFNISIALGAWSSSKLNESTSMAPGSVEPILKMLEV